MPDPFSAGLPQFEKGQVLKAEDLNAIVALVARQLLGPGMFVGSRYVAQRRLVTGGGGGGAGKIAVVQFPNPGIGPRIGLDPGNGVANLVIATGYEGTIQNAQNFAAGSINGGMWGVVAEIGGADVVVTAFC